MCFSVIVRIIQVHSKKYGGEKQEKEIKIFKSPLILQPRENTVNMILSNFLPFVRKDIFVMTAKYHTGKIHSNT